MDTRAPLERISKVAGVTLSAHDLRRTFVSVGVATCGIDLHKIELLTNHVPKGRYGTTTTFRPPASSTWSPEVQRIGDWIEQQGRLAEAKGPRRECHSFAGIEGAKACKTMITASARGSLTSLAGRSLFKVLVVAS